MVIREQRLGIVRNIQNKVGQRDSFICISVQRMIRSMLQQELFFLIWQMADVEKWKGTAIGKRGEDYETFKKEKQNNF